MRRRIIFWGLFSLGFCMLFCTPGQADDVPAYNRQLESISSNLNTLLRQERLHPGSAAQAITRLSESLPAAFYVSQREGRTVRVDIGWLRDGLKGAAKAGGNDRLLRLQGLLDRVRAQQEAARSIRHIARSSVGKSQAALLNVLARREYRPSKPEQFWQKIAAFVGGLLNNLDVPSGVADVIMWALLAIIIVVFVALLAWLVWRLMSLVSLRSAERAPRSHRTEASIAILSQSTVLEAAERDAAAGRYKEAFRGLYLAAILALDKANLVKYADGVTNREYLRILTRQGVEDAVTAFGPMTESFDELIYGKRHISEREYGECRRRYDELERVI